MAVPNSTTPVEQMTNANEDLIVGLREVADFLEQHPELPDFRAYIAHYEYGDGSRAVLSHLADALSERATESSDGRRVTIIGHFGDGVRIAAEAPLDKLGGAVQVRPAYPRIINRGRLAS